MGSGMVLSRRQGLVDGLLVVAAAVLAFLSSVAAQAEAKSLRLDCGTATSAVMKGYVRLTGDDMYDPARGYGWEGTRPESREFADLTGIARRERFGGLGWDQYIRDNLTDLNRDSATSADDMVFRADVPNGTYRVTITVGDMTQAIGSVDVRINGQLAGSQVAAWTPGGYRILLAGPIGWWTKVRKTVEVTDGLVRIALSRNQSYYDEQMAHQYTYENPYRRYWWSAAPEKDPPYYYIGWPFTRNSVMAIEILPDLPPPVTAKEDKLSLSGPVSSPALSEAISLFNQGDFAGAAKALERVTEPEAQVARAVVQLWLAGRPEIETEKQLVPAALSVLRDHLARHPEENGLAELVEDAEIFSRALDIHMTRGELGKNHGIENNKAIGWGSLIKEDSPLYYKSQLYVARAAHMHLPYFPTLGTEAEILKKLEKKFPDNRFVKYLLHWTWQPYGDGTRRDDWYMADYASMVRDAPKWVQEAYPAWSHLLDWAEWIIRYKQGPEGGIGGGLSDDVEMVGALGYMGYTSLGISELAVPGARKLCEGVWRYGDIDDQIGYLMHFADSEHSAEPTGDSLGMMVQIDYGNPVWIERSMKTGKLMRDFWTARNEKGRRHFRSNFFGATQIGSGDQMNDSWINYRAAKPAGAVIWYNRNPAASQLFIELAEAWLDAAMSTDRGKPEGIIPAEVSFPEGLIGGKNSPNWYTSVHAPNTVNYDWEPQNYKAHMHDLFLTAYALTGEARYLEPMRLEFELAAKYGRASLKLTGARLQELEPTMNDGSKLALARWENPAARIEDIPLEREVPKEKAKPEEAAAEVGSESWVGQKLKYVDAWLTAKRVLEGRKGPLQNDITKEEAMHVSRFTKDMLKLRWPLMTTESSATDRAAFVGIMNPFFVYTGGKFGGPLLEAAVTYENTTRYFAAMVLGTDRQGFRLLYYSLAPESREIGICPWDLEPGARYQLRYGPDANDDDVMDAVLSTREFDLPQRGTPIRITVEPRKVYVVEVDQVARGKGTILAPDPGISDRDIRYSKEYGLILATVHNIGSRPVKNVEVAVYDGNPEAGGGLLGTTIIPNIEAPNDLDARMVTVGFGWTPSKDAHDIYVQIDPKDEIKDEITTFNNEAHSVLPRAEEQAVPARQVPKAQVSGRR